MKERIFRGILMVTLAVLAFCVVLIMSITYDYFTDRSWDEIASEAALIKVGVEKEGLNYLESVPADNNIRITWIDEKGNVLFDSNASAGSMENHLSRSEIQTALQGGVGRAERYSATLSQKTIYYAIRLKNGTVLRVSSQQISPLSLLVNNLWPILLVIVMAVLASFWLAYRLSRKIVKPINEMDLEHPEANKTYRELQPLLHRLEKQYERIAQEVESKESLRREFSANVSHELKTPLTSISGTAEIMQSGMIPAEDIPHFAGNIYKESRRLITLIEDIMKISQLDEKQIPMEAEQVDLAELARQEAERVRPAAEQRNIRIRLDSPRADGRQPVVTGVRQILREMVFNLLDNAVKYNQDGGSIVIDTGWQGGQVVMSISDTGIGIPEEDQQRVFERFYRVDKSHSKAIGGTGLGLSIVKHAALYHKASIELESRLGSGTKITIRFPDPQENGSVK